jgi:hypothetical protein
MNKENIINLVNAGVPGITNLTLSGKHAYKVLKFRRAILAVHGQICDEFSAIFKEAGIEDPQAFDKERNELRTISSRTAEQEARLAELDKTFVRYKELEEEMLKEEVKLDCVPMPYEDFHALQKENEKTCPALAHGYIEDVLEGVLWTAPEE